jgi:hypothetical protein
MNTIANTIQCINGLCGHSTHKLNAIWWIIPTIIISLYIARKFKKVI